MSLQQTLNDTVSSVPDCLAAGYVDLSTGMLLGIKTVDSHPQQVIDLLAAATGDLFQGPTVVSIEKIFKQSRGIDPDNEEHYFEEIIVMSKNLIHVFVRSKNGQQVLVTVCRPTANMGMVLTKTRAALGGVEATV